MRRLCLVTILREWRGPGPADYARIVDDSIRQTLTRWLYTVLAVFCGTYSSIFIAPAAWHALARRVSVPAMAG